MLSNIHANVWEFLAKTSMGDAVDMMDVVSDVMAERTRQVELKYDIAHDDEHDKGEMAVMAAHYINKTRGINQMTDGDNEKSLLKAAALLVAEVARLRRQKKTKHE